MSQCVCMYMSVNVCVCVYVCVQFWVIEQHLLCVRARQSLSQGSVSRSTHTHIFLATFFQVTVISLAVCVCVCFSYSLSLCHFLNLGTVHTLQNTWNLPKTPTYPTCKHWDICAHTYIHIHKSSLCVSMWGIHTWWLVSFRALRATKLWLNHQGWQYMCAYTVCMTFWVFSQEKGLLGGYL